MQNKNFLLFVALSFLLLVGYMQVKNALWPPAKPIKKDIDDEAKIEQADRPKGPPVAPKAIAGPWADLKKPERPAVKPVVKLPVAAPATPADKLITLGQDQAPDGSPSPFHLKVVLDPRGAGVRSVLLNKFQQSDDMGRPVWRDDKKRIAAPLELVPEAANREQPSNVLYHFRAVDDSRPVDALGKAAWTPGPVEVEEISDGRKRQRVSFQTEIQGVRITKTYTLAEGEYHIGLEVKLTRQGGEDGNRKFRYQLAGAHGLPIEGRWYTSTFRNALIARIEGTSVWRDLQDEREISRWEGGNEILSEPKRPIRYAGVAVQYFASMTVVDNEQKNQDFIKQARPTLETGVARGVIKKIDRERGTFVLVSDQLERTFHVGSDQQLRDELEEMKDGARRAVIYHNDSAGRSIVTRIGQEMAIQPLWEEDITVRVSTDTVELKPGEEVTHKYLLYNGPVKPSLLAGQKGAAAVSPELVERYATTLSLNTMTDYHSPNAFGRFANAIYWTQLIILFTNLNHAILGMLYWVVPSYGICIVLLTVLVRGAMFPLSRRQALMSLKMQALAPELKKLTEKYKDDPQARGLAQMELYRRHGIHPLGTCWLLLLQMPVFMGLYFCLQESIQFRLAPFWPTWIINLAAPDMMIRWGESIPIISRPEDYGGLLYLGPYFNLLPVIAVTLMIVQQKMMTPPATDEQQQMQQAMMKYMMIFFGLMFYKVASGLCIYFIASSLWGFAERKLLPKFQHKTGDAAETREPATSSTEPDGQGRGARSMRGKRKPDRPREPDQSTALGRLRAWWADVLEQAKKK